MCSPPVGAIEARGLLAGYGDRRVLRGLDFTFAEGRTTVVVGPGGAGKTTLLQTLAGEAERQEDLWHTGTLRVPAAAPRTLCQRLPETGTVTELLGAGRRRDVAPRRVLDEVWRPAPGAAAVLAEVLEAPLAALPLGLRRLAAFTAAVAVEAPWLLLDEPDAEMEPEAVEWIIAKLRELRGTRTLVIVTRHLRVTRAVADDVLLLIDGTICEAAETEHFFERPCHPRTRRFVAMGC